MKVALCYSGQVGAALKAYNNQKNNIILPNDCDIFCQTSDAVSQKGSGKVYLNLPNKTNPVVYMPAGKGWRKNYTTYGMIYNVEKNLIDEMFKHLYGKKLISYEIESEEIKDSNHDLMMTKWEWMRLRQLYKLKKCNQLLKDSKKEYDIVIRSRFEFTTAIKIDVEKILHHHGGLEKNENSVFVFGGFSCTPPMIFMDEYFCDGLFFSTPKTMNKLVELADKVEPYPPHPKYVGNWEKWGDSIEHQFRSHAENNNIKIKYISEKRSDYVILR